MYYDRGRHITSSFWLPVKSCTNGYVVSRSDASDQ